MVIVEPLKGLPLLSRKTPPRAAAGQANAHSAAAGRGRIAVEILQLDCDRGRLTGEEGLAQAW